MGGLQTQSRDDANSVSIEQTIWDLEVELLEIIDPGYRAALERYIAGDDGSEAVVDPVRDPGKGIVG